MHWEYDKRIKAIENFIICFILIQTRKTKNNYGEASNRTSNLVSARNDWQQHKRIKFVQFVNRWSTNWATSPMKCWLFLIEFNI